MPCLSDVKVSIHSSLVWRSCDVQDQEPGRERWRGGGVLAGVLAKDGCAPGGDRAPVRRHARRAREPAVTAEMSATSSFASCPTA